MRITGPDIPQNKKTVPKISAKPHVPVKPGTVSAKTSGTQLVLGKLGRIFTDHGAKVSRQHMVSIASELMSLDISSEMVDETTALRALLLSRNNIPLNREALLPGNEQQSVLFKDIASLVQEAGSLLSRGRLTGEGRTVIERFVKNISALFQTDRGFDPLVADGERLSSVLLKNGMSFESRLLAWYQAGHDPVMLRTLVEDDLKGVLIEFLNKLRKKDIWKKIPVKSHESMERKADSALKTLTNRQLANLLETHVSRKGFMFDLPFGKHPAEGNASVVAKGKREKKESGKLTSGDFTLSFEVQTTNLGAVTAFMTVSGMSVSLRFELDDCSAVSLGESMADEVCDGLRRQGYAIGDVVFHERAAEQDVSRQSPITERNVDIKG